ncbi:unnamed protein product [Closterium sp. NIES-53]
MGTGTVKQRGDAMGGTVKARSAPSAYADDDEPVNAFPSLPSPTFPPRSAPSRRAERPPVPPKQAAAAGMELEAKRRKGTDFFAGARQAMEDGTRHTIADSTRPAQRASPGLQDKLSAVYAAGNTVPIPFLRACDISPLSLIASSGPDGAPFDQCGLEAIQELSGSGGLAGSKGARRTPAAECGLEAIQELSGSGGLAGSKGARRTPAAEAGGDSGAVMEWWAGKRQIYVPFPIHAFPTTPRSYDTPFTIPHSQYTPFPLHPVPTTLHFHYTPFPLRPVPTTPGPRSITNTAPPTPKEVSLRVVNSTFFPECLFQSPPISTTPDPIPATPHFRCTPFPLQVPLPPSVYRTLSNCGFNPKCLLQPCTPFPLHPDPTTGPTAPQCIPQTSQQHHPPQSRPSAGVP